MFKNSAHGLGNVEGSADGVAQVHVEFLFDALVLNVPGDGDSDGLGDGDGMRGGDTLCEGHRATLGFITIGASFTN